MTTLTEFLLERIAEDARRRTAFWHDMECPTAYSAGNECTCGSQARVLAECEAKRRIVTRHSTCDDVSYGDASTCPDMRDLALPHADHPDYQEAWKP